LAGRCRAFLRGLAALSLGTLLVACAIDPVPTPGQGDVRGNQLDDKEVFVAPDGGPGHADVKTGGCTCIDELGHEWNCDSGAGTDACPCEPSAITCPEGTPECEGAEVPEGVEPGEVVEP